MKTRSTLRLVLTAALLPLLPLLTTPGTARAADAGTHVGGILSADTTWTADQGPYYVDGVVQIASGVTLHVEPGTQILLAGPTSGFAPIFQVAGTLDVAGSAEAPVSLVGQGSAGVAGPVNNAGHAVLSLKHVDVSGFASVFPPTAGSGHADYELSDSTVTGTTYLSYFWYPVSYARVERNVFVNAASMTFGTTGAVATVVNNRFRGYSTSSTYRHHLESWAAYQHPLQVHGNTFEPGPNPVMTVRSDGAIDASGNDWSTTDAASAKARVIDQEDNLNLPSVVTVDPLLDGPAPETPAIAPTRPVGATAARGDQQATVSWTQTADGGSPVTGHTVTVSPGDRTVQVPGDATSAVVDGLTNGTAYSFTVSATNALGSSAPSSATADVTPAGLPSAPGQVFAQQGDGYVRLAWSSASANGAPLSGYTVTASPGGQAVTVPGDMTSASFSGLTQGTAYTFTVTATNEVGESLPTAPSNEVVAARAPSAPAQVTAVPRDQAALVTWTPSTANGADVLGYFLTAYPGGRQVQVVGGDTASYLVTGLHNGTEYTFTVAAASWAGSSEPVSSNVAVPSGKPGTMTRPTATLTARTVSLRWTAPATNGSPITAYVVRCSNGRKVTTSGDARRAAFARLAPGSYRFKVAARNAVGTAAWSPAITVRVR